MAGLSDFPYQQTRGSANMIFSSTPNRKQTRGRDGGEVTAKKKKGNGENNGIMMENDGKIGEGCRVGIRFSRNTAGFKVP